MPATPCLICDAPADSVIAATSLAVAAHYPNAVTLGHFVVGVKRHAATFADVTPDEAAAVFSLAQQLVSLGEQMQPLEKHYLAVIGDVDAHFHVHCLPKRVDDAKLGPFIMSPAGWRGALTVLDAPDHESFVNDLRTRFQEGGSC